ncbi:hypothetical protein [Brachybacterium alimentarium]|uniref:hypothetical protein n=1 Tax=Brachybacterium alimentarium TaxID=47845 RepID=UPI003FCFD5A8
MTKATSIDEYLAQHDEPGLSRPQELRSLSQEAAPQATEAITWGPRVPAPPGQHDLLRGQRASEAG